jgi:hypothetical protein
MKKLVERFGKLITASLFFMGIGFVVFLLTPLLYGFWEIDTDIPGAFIFIIGVIVCIVGFARRSGTRRKQ